MARNGPDRTESWALVGRALLLLGVVFAFALLHGISNGLLTITKATLPVETFGLHGVGAVLGNFSAPSLITRALAPLGFAVLTGTLGTGSALACLAAAGLATVVTYVATTRGVPGG